MSDADYMELAHEGVAAFEAQQSDLKDAYAGAGVGGRADADSDIEAYNFGDADEAAGAQSGAAAADYARTAQAHTTAMLLRAGHDCASLAGVDACEECGSAVPLVISCSTCDVNCRFLCPSCDRRVHTFAQDHRRLVLAGERGGRALAPLALRPSDFVALAPPYGAGGGRGIVPAELERVVVPASFALRHPHVCSASLSTTCSRVTAAEWDDEHPLRVLGVNGEFWQGRVTQFRCRRCRAVVPLPADGVDANTGVATVTVDRPRCAFTLPMLRQLVSLMVSLEGAVTIGRVRQWLIELCGYAPPKQTLGVFLRQQLQLEVLAARGIAGSDVSCFSCHERGDLVVGVDASLAAFNFRTQGFTQTLTVPFPVIETAQDAALVLAAAAPISTNASSACELVTERIVGGGGSEWLAGRDRGDAGNIKRSHGLFVMSCHHGNIARGTIMENYESPRLHIKAVLEQLPLQLRAGARGAAALAAPPAAPAARAPAPAAARAPAPATARVAPAAPAARILLQTDIACIAFRSILANVAADQHWLSHIFQTLFPREGKRIVVVVPGAVPADWAARPKNPTLVLQVSERPAGADGEPDFPAWAFTFIVNFLIGGMHAAAHLCCCSLHQFDLVSIPRAGSEADFVEWSTALLARHAAPARPLGQGQFYLYWETVVKAQWRAAANALPLALVREFITARAKVALCRADLEAALDEYNAQRVKSKPLELDGVAAFVAGKIEGFTPSLRDDGAAKAGKAASHALKVQGARGALAHALWTSLGVPVDAAPAKRARTAGAAAAAAAGGGGGGARPPTHEQEALFALLVRSSNDLGAIRSFKGVVPSALVNIAEGERLLKLFDAELAKRSYAVDRLGTDDALQSCLSLLRVLAGEASALRAKLLASQAAHGEHDGQAQAVKVALQRVLAKMGHARGVLVTMGKANPAKHGCLGKLPPAGELSVRHLSDVRYVPLHLQPPKPAHEASWMPLYVASQKYAAAQVALDQSVAGVANARAVAERVRDEVVARAEALAARVAAGVSPADLVAAAGPSQLVVDADTDTTLMPYTATVVGAAECELAAGGLQVLLQHETRRLARLARDLVLVDEGVREVALVAPAPSSLPVDAVGRTLLGQEAPALLGGATSPAAWARFALPGAVRGAATAGGAAAGRRAAARRRAPRAPGGGAAHATGGGGVRTGSVGRNGDGEGGEEEAEEEEEEDDRDGRVGRALYLGLAKDRMRAMTTDAGEDTVTLGTGGEA